MARNVTTVEIRGEDKTRSAFRSAGTALDKYNRKLEKTTSKTSLLAGGMGKLGGAVAGLVGFGMLSRLSSQLLILGDRIGKVSQQTGIGTVGLQKLQFAAEQSGVGAENMNKALQKLNDNIGESILKGGPAAEAFTSLGVAVLNTNGSVRGSEAVFQDVSEALSNVESDAIRAKIANDLFGRAGVELLPLLNVGVGALESYGDQLERVGGVISDESINRIQRFNDSVNLLTKSFRGFLTGSGMLEISTQIVEGWTFGIERMNKVFSDPQPVKQVTTLKDANQKILEIENDLNVTLNEQELFRHRIQVLSGEGKETAEADLKNGSERIEQLRIELKDVESIKVELTKTETTTKKIAAIEIARNANAKKFATTTKKSLPDFKNLDKLVGTSAKALKSLQGREGFGGLLLEITKFFINADLLFKDYFGYITDTTEGGLNSVLYRFEELMLRLDNVTVFTGNRIRNSFAQIMGDIEANVLQLDIRVPAIIVPASAFSFEKVEGAGQKLDQLGNQINSYSVSARSRSRDAAFGGTSITRYHSGLDPAHSIFWADQIPAGGHIDRSNALSYDVPAVTTGNGGGSGASSGRSSPGAREAAGQGGGGGVVVNIYDGTGQQISAYDSAIRVEIKERSNRLGMIPALNVSGV